MIEWRKRYGFHIIIVNSALLSLDTFSAHLTGAVKAEFEKCNTKLLIIPGGCTYVLQPLDISINKPFNYIWCQYIVDECETKSSLLDITLDHQR